MFYLKSACTTGYYEVPVRSLRQQVDLAVGVAWLAVVPRQQVEAGHDGHNQLVARSVIVQLYLQTASV